MTEPNPPENLDAGNERSLRKLAWAIEASRGQFKLILARCNYTGVRGRLVRELPQLVSGEIRILELQASDRTLYGRIQAVLGANVPVALTVFGLEAVGDIEQLLTSTNQVREEFQKHFPFPLVLWVSDDVFKKLVRVAPDFESWAIGVEFAVAGEDVASFVRETAERWFANTLRITRQGALELEAELQAAEKDLLGGGEGLDKELQANLESLLGAVKFMYNERDAALEHYQKALGLWRETGNLDRQAKLVSEIALCYSLKAARGEINPSDWQEIGDSLRESLDVFERAERPDLVAILIPLVCGVLRQFEEWEGLRALASKALQLHDRENMPVELAQDFGFLAEVEIANERWGEARDFAQRALQVLGYDLGQGEGQGEGQAGRLSYASRYLFILAQAQYHLQQFEEAIRNLEAANEAGSPEYDTQLYLDILHRLQALYSEGKKYLEAFEIKLERLSVEQQYGLRAFVGAGRIQPQRQAKFALTPVVGRGVAPQQENVAPEIAASGRMLDVERLIEKIGRNDSKLIVIHGQSGVGKSSLVNGGLVPALKEKVIGIEDVLPVPVWVYTHWVAELGRALIEALADSRVRSPRNAPYSVEAILEQLRQNEHRHLRTVLIFDQFEEFFFVCTSPAQRRQFFAFLGESLKILSAKVILSLREDYLHYLLECNRQESMKVIGNDILSNNVLYPLGNFSPEDAKSVVLRLTERSNFRPDGDLIEELVGDLAGELGEVRPIELQVVGAQLQEEKITTLAGYRERGPKTEFVKRYLEEVVTDCGAENKRAAELVLYLLTDEKGTRPLKTRAELERDVQVLAAELAGESSRLDLVLEIFVGSGMVLLLPESPADRYQLVHDYLAALIREQQQPKFNELIAELEREREQRQLAEAKQLQAEEERKQAEKARQILEAANKKATLRIRMASGVLAVSLVASAIIGIKAATTLQEARKGTQLERDGLNALRQYEFRQIEALISAMQAWQELKAVFKNKPVEDYPTATPILAVQTILDSIRERNQLKGHQGDVTSASFSPDGKRILTASSDNTARVWDSTGKLLSELKGHQGPVISASFSPDGKRILTASWDKTARVWDSTGKLLSELKGHQGDVTSASFSPDGKRILTASSDNTARVWDSTGKLLSELKGHQGPVISASFSPDGKRILTASWDKTARVWDSTGKLLSELKGHQGYVISASFSPDGKRILTASWDNTARVWDSTGKLLSELKGHQGPVISASFSPDGKRILTAS
ncbi:nSTAND1 domain-containing NTPase, partial [Kamptonema formosum]|uniref:nSTAND1 domain-containing NTPase n=1 Tax=Kamptonema formosum TaxID=331992 RepID=UPI00037C2245